MMSKRSEKPNKSGKKFAPAKKFVVKKKRSQLEDEEIRSLEVKLNELMSVDFEVFAKQVKKFDDFPLSSKTAKGLQDAKFTEPTEIQRCAILPALLGFDVLGGAKTGSGKTLAFLIPILEKLYKERWSRRDGLGALIISPTRELALQTFKVLKTIGKYHDISADLVIGGKFLKEERARINQTNIVICTPGRLKQHLETTFNFRADNLHVLVLDEADRILDLGFQRQMTEISENLPEDRQTLLFSATQTRVVRDLARISMRGKPVLVFTNDLRGQSTPTPDGLQQSYIVCELSEKVDILWSFVKSNLKSKIIIFFSTCKQVRFVYEVFRRMRPGITVLALHSKMKYLKRLSMCEMFGRKQNAILFATDIAARGLDFPVVKWVIQADCPVDVKTYIHRSGRTARSDKDGESMLFLLPSEEEEMVRLLKEKNLNVEKKKVDQRKRASIQKKMSSLCAADVSLKEFAQRAFVAYLKFVVMAGNKKVFDVTALDLEKFACSLGLAFPPTVKFVTKRKEELAAKRAAAAAAVASNGAAASSSSDEDGDDSDSDNDDGSSSDDSSDSASRSDRKDVDNRKSQVDAETDEKDDDFLLKKKTDICADEIDSLSDDLDTNLIDQNSAKAKKKDSKFAVAKKILKKQLKVNTKVVFDDEGLPVDEVHRQLHSSLGKNSDAGREPSGGIDIGVAKQRLIEQDKLDKQRYQEKIKQKHREKRLKLKEEQRKKRQRDTGDQYEVYLSLSRGAVELVEDEDSDGPDISFLPDPDKVYGPSKGSDADSDDDDDDSVQNSSSSEGSDSSENEEESDDSETLRRANIGSVAKKRKLVKDDKNPSKKSRASTNANNSSDINADNSSDNESESDNEENTGLSLVDDEAIALKLLQS